MMKITIIYDNETSQEGLKPDWGFACLVEAYGRRILFDTGENGSILLHNMKNLEMEPATVDEVFISHPHSDHTGGLHDFLEMSSVKIYAPSSIGEVSGATEVIKVKEPLEIHQHIFSTGELKGIEQSLVIKTDKGSVVIAGCSHSGVKNILDAASRVQAPRALIGGLHGFRDFDELERLKLICPTHCTQHTAEIRTLCPDKCVAGGAGTVIEI